MSIFKYLGVIMLLGRTIAAVPFQSRLKAWEQGCMFFFCSVHFHPSLLQGSALQFIEGLLPKLCLKFYSKMCQTENILSYPTAPINFR